MANSNQNLFDSLAFDITIQSAPTNGNDSLVGTSGNDPIDGLDGNDIILGIAGDDYLYGGKGNDTLDGGADDDYFDPGDGIDSVIGSDGIDTLILDYYNKTSPITITYISTNNGTVSTGETFQDIESVKLDSGSGNDTINLSATSGDSYVVGGSGKDLITIGSGNDTLDGGEGNDTLDGGAGNDYFDPGDGIDSVIGGAGNDTLYLDYYYETSPITLTYTSPGNGTVSTGDTFQDIEAINITSGKGNDRITTSSGNDYLYGGDGNDTLSGGAGNDTYYIDNPSDRIIEKTGEGTDTVESDITYTLTGTNLENLILTGYDNTNGIGNAENNQIKGNKQNNIIKGKEGKDKLNGYNGNDTLVGGLGNDTLTGSVGQDYFVFNAPTEGIDQIKDFDYAYFSNDTISVSAAGFGAGLVSGVYLKANQFTIGSAATTSAHRFVYDAATGALFFDSNGNASGGVTQFATLSTGLRMTEQDIYVTV